MDKDFYAVIGFGTLSGMLLSMAIFFSKEPTLLRVIQGTMAAFLITLTFISAIDYAVTKIKEK